MGLIPWQNTITNETEQPVIEPVVTVRNVSDNSLADLYSDAAGTPALNPITGDENGFVQFWVDAGEYSIQGAKSGVLTNIWYWDAVDLDAGQPYADRATMIADLANVPDAKTVVSHFIPNGETISYAKFTGATEIADVLGYVTDGPMTLEHFGAVGDGATDDQTAYTRALATGKPIYLHEGRRYLVTNSDNVDGRVLYGPGRVIEAITGGYTQKNSYVPPLPVQGRQRLNVVKTAINTGTHLKIGIIGDSTATDGYGLVIATAVRDELRRIGVNVETVVNGAVAGTGWTTSSTNVNDIVDGWAEQKHLVIIKFGINDAAADGSGNPDVTAMRNAMRTNLTNLRAGTYGGQDDLSIILLMPNPLENSATNTAARNKLWLEAIIGAYQDAADDFGCAIYNPYVEAPSARGGEDRFMDAALVHPQANFNLDIWGRCIREMLMPMASIPTNRDLNIGATGETGRLASAALTDYNKGRSLYRAASADGWPITGVVETVRQNDNIGYQTLFDYQLAYPVRLTRTWTTGSSAWSGWSNARTALPVGPNIASVGANEDLTYGRTPDGHVWAHGTGLTSGDITAGSGIIGTLPAGHRPAKQCLRWVTLLDGTRVRVRINTNGTIIPDATIGTGLYVTLELSFRV